MTRGYVTNNNSDTVSVIDTATGTVVGPPIAVGDTPLGISVNPTGTRVYVANYNGNSVSVIDAATNTVVGAPVSAGSSPVAFGRFIGPAPQARILWRNCATGKNMVWQMEGINKTRTANLPALASPAWRMVDVGQRGEGIRSVIPSGERLELGGVLWRCV